MQTQVDQQRLRMKQLMSRIEDQCVERFDKKYQTSKFDPEQELSQADLVNIIIEWLEYWHNERPVIKVPHVVQEIKQKVCDIRIYRILLMAYESNVLDQIPEYLRGGCTTQKQDCAVSVQQSHESCHGQLQS
jgi:hypothetical protein